MDSTNSARKISFCLELQFCFAECMQLVSSVLHKLFDSEEFKDYGWFLTNHRCHTICSPPRWEFHSPFATQQTQACGRGWTWEMMAPFKSNILDHVRHAISHLRHVNTQWWTFTQKISREPWPQVPTTCTREHALICRVVIASANWWLKLIRAELGACVCHVFVFVWQK